MYTLTQAATSTKTSEIVTLEFGNQLRDESNAKGIKHLPMNRKRNKRHVKELAEDMQKNGFTTVITVFKNETGTETYVSDLEEGAYYILDGSHRFDAAAQAEIEIRYILVPEGTSIKALKDVSLKLIGLNDKSKIWSVKDYITHYSKNLTAYQILAEFTQKYAHLQLRTIACYLSTGKVEHSKSNAITKGIREGAFALTVNVKDAETLFDNSTQIVKHVPLDATNKRDFNIFLLTYILRESDKFCVDTFKEHVNLNISKIQKFCSQKPEDREANLSKLFAKCPK